MMKKLFLIAILSVFATDLLAQSWGQTPLVDRPRDEDHHWKKRILTRIDMKEKENMPLQEVMYQEHMNYDNIYRPNVDGYYRNKKGVIKTLVKAYFANQGTPDALVAYEPENLEKALTLNDLKDRWAGYYCAQAASSAQEKPAEDKSGGDDSGFEDDFGFDDFDDGFSFDDMDSGMDFGDDLGGGGGGGAAGGGGAGECTPVAEIMKDKDIPGSDVIFELVEDVIFDKNKSSIYHDILYIRIFVVDETNTVQTTYPMMAFKYEDVRDILASTQWKNPHNDAEMRNALEILDNRMFRGTFLNVSAEMMDNLDIAEKRRQQMVEYEHNLWEY